MALRIGTVLNLPLNRLTESLEKLDPAQPVVTVCNSAYRSMMAAGILERAGFRSVSNLAGGSEAWIEAGLPVFEAHDAGSPGSTPKRVVRLAERVSAADLKRMVMDLPDSFQLVDIRPAAQFADYHLPGSMNVAIGELIDNPAFLVGAGPLIVVDRDGSLAMMVAGILSQKTDRPVKVLYGGLRAYWNEAGPGAAVSPAAMPALPAASSGRAATAPAALTRQAPQTRPKKKSAGC
jgi:rhodanese-related sulfurtransferase